MCQGEAAVACETSAKFVEQVTRAKTPLRVGLSNIPVPRALQNVVAGEVQGAPQDNVLPGSVKSSLSNSLSTPQSGSTEKDPDQCDFEFVDIVLRPGKELPFMLVRCNGNSDDATKEAAARTRGIRAAIRSSSRHRDHLQWTDPACLGPKSPRASKNHDGDDLLRREAIISPNASLACLRTLVLETLTIQAKSVASSKDIYSNVRHTSLGQVRQKLAKAPRKVRKLRFVAPPKGSGIQMSPAIVREQSESGAVNEAPHERATRGSSGSAPSTLPTQPIEQTPSPPPAQLNYASPTGRETLVEERNGTLTFAGNIDRNNTERQASVVRAFEWAWVGYRLHAWGRDELKPISRKGHDWFGIGKAELSLFYLALFVALTAQCANVDVSGDVRS